MQLLNDPLHIVNLHTNRFVHLAQTPDPDKLFASSMIRRGSGLLPLRRSEPFDIQTNFGDGSVVLHLKYRGLAACWGTFVPGTFAARENWQEAHAFHRSLLSRCRPPQPWLPRSAMPAGPWLALTFFPRCLTVLSVDQITRATAALWGVTRELRRLDRPDYEFN
jgi:hypothetical protein